MSRQLAPNLIDGTDAASARIRSYLPGRMLGVDERRSADRAARLELDDAVRLANEGRDDDAEDACRSVIAADDPVYSWWARRNLGLHLLVSLRLSEAEALFREAIATAPNPSAVLALTRSLASSLKGQGRLVARQVSFTSWRTIETWRSSESPLMLALWGVCPASGERASR